MTTIGGQSSDVIDRWLLDASQFKDELQNCAKLIRQSQKEEKDLQEVRTALDKETQKLTGSVAQLSQKFGEAASNLKMIAFERATALAGQLKNEIGGLVSEGLKWNRAFGDGKRSVDEMSKASAYLIDDFELLKTKVRLTTGDFKASEAQLEALSKASVIYARIVKIDKVTALQNLTEAIVGGRGAEKALRMMGIQTNLVGDEAYKTHEALNVLVDKFGKTEIGAKNAAEQIDAMKNKLGDNVGQLTSAIMKTATMRDTMEGASLAAKTLADSIKIASGRLSTFSAEGLKTQASLARLLSAFTGRAVLGGEALDLGAGAIDALARQQAADEASASAFGGFSNDPFRDNDLNAAAIEGEWGLDLVGHKKDKVAGGKKRKGDFTPRIDRVVGQEAINRYYSEIAKSYGGEKSREREAEFSREMAIVQREYQERLKLIDLGVKENLATEKRVEKIHEERDAEEKLQDAMTRTAHLLADREKQIREMSVGALAQFTGGLWAAADAAIQGGQSFEQAMLQMLKSTLLGIAQQATVKAIFETAEGFAMLATTWGIPNPSATLHFTSAGIYGGIAAVTGAAGLGISAATAGGGGGAGTGAAAAGGASGYRPSTSSREQKQTKTVIKVVAAADDPVLQAALAAAQFRSYVVDDESN